MPPLIDGDGSEPIDPKLLALWRMRAAVALVLVGLTAAIGLGVTVGPIASAASLVAVSVVGSVVWWVCGVEWRAIRFVVGEENLEIRRGVLQQRASLIPYHRVQHVDLESGPIERWLGIATIRLRTAAATSDSQVPGIAAERAQELRALVLRRIGRGDAV